MKWKPILIGADATGQAAVAARVGLDLAERAATTARLVHAVEKGWSAPIGTQVVTEAVRFNAALADAERARVAAFLRERIPPAQADRIDVRMGRTEAVLLDVVRESEPELVVLGGKQHSAISRWLGGSTAQYAVRTLHVPVLITAHEPGPFQRVLIAVDLSEAAAPTITWGERIAALYGSQVRVVHVVAPLPPVLDLPLPYDKDQAMEWSTKECEKTVWPLVRYAGAEKVMRYGVIPETIEQEVKDFDADLLVVGTHGRGWLDRVLIGSITERLAADLPCSTLIVPVPKPGGTRK